ncbi:MAG: hypothetical protein IT458_00840 [Planctomycetes bacterium]|nr:hypothetical protein [Planctomycetota bacterium]
MSEAAGAAPAVPRGAGTPGGVVWALVAAAFVWRWVLAQLTPVPAEDGVNYLWMAQEFARGRLGAGLAEVFPPLLPLLAAPGIALGLDPLLAARAVLCVAGALALVPIARLTAGATPAVRVVVIALAGASPLAARFCGEVYTEPLFVLLAALALDAGLRGRDWCSGLWAACATWTRPEGAALALAFALVRPRTAWRALLVVGTAVAALALLRGALGHGYAPIAKLPILLERANVAGGDLRESLARFAQGALALPGIWIEAFDVLGVLGLAGAGLVLFGRESARRREFLPLFVLLGLVLVAILAFVPRRRFLVGWLAVLAPFAALACRGLPQRWLGIVLVAGLAIGAVRGFRVTGSSRLVERDLGRYLATRLAPGEDVATDLTRVRWYAGLRPLPPRHFAAEELIAASLAPGVRFVVIGVLRPTAATWRAALGASFVPAALPAGLAERLPERGVEVFERR